MAKKLTPEEKAQRELDKAAQKIAARQAAMDAKRAQWEAERQQAIATFQTSLSQKDKDAIAKILVPKEMIQDSYRPEGVLKAVFDNDFIESLYTQLQTRGFLSSAQLAAVVRQYDRVVEVESQASVWPSIQQDQDVAVLCKIISIDPRDTGGYGPSFKIKMKSHYGRIFHVNTNAQRFLTVARAAFAEKVPVNVQGKVGWVSPDTRVVVLDKKGLYFQSL